MIGTPFPAAEAAGGQGLALASLLSPYLPLAWLRTTERAVWVGLRAGCRMAGSPPVCSEGWTSQVDQESDWLLWTLPVTLGMSPTDRYKCFLL